MYPFNIFVLRYNQRPLYLHLYSLNYYLLANIKLQIGLNYFNTEIEDWIRYSGIYLSSWLLIKVKMVFRNNNHGIETVPTQL